MHETAIVHQGAVLYRDVWLEEGAIVGEGIELLPHAHIGKNGTAFLKVAYVIEPCNVEHIIDPDNVGNCGPDVITIYDNGMSSGTVGLNRTAYLFSEKVPFSGFIGSESDLCHRHKKMIMKEIPLRESILRNKNVA